MAYNHGREDRKWRIWKEAEEKLLRECGVDEATIEQMNKKDVCATKVAYVRFTEDDLADLDRQVRRGGAPSRGAYIRNLVKKIRPVELPPADYLSLLDELSSLRRSIDALAARAAEGGTSTLNPVEYYTLSSLTALTLQKIRLAALPQQCQLPEDMIHE